MDQKKEFKKAKELGCVLSYIMKHKEFNHGSVYVPKDINKTNIEYLRELRTLAMCYLQC